MISINLNNVEEAVTWKRLPAGGYVCRYTNVTDVPNKEYLLMEFDIDEGEYRGYYKKLEADKGYWGGKCYRSYKQAALPMFKRMCSAVAKSNPGFIYDGVNNHDERTLIGKRVGLVFGEEEYIGNDGSVRTRLYISYECSIEDIRKGNYQNAKFKALPTSEKQATTSTDFVSVPDRIPEQLPWQQ